MKINLLEFNQKNNDSVEIIFVKDLKDFKEDKSILEILDFKIKDENLVFLPESKKLYVAYEEETYDSLAICISLAIKKIKTTKFTNISVFLNDTLEKNFKALVEGSLLGNYFFNKYKSEQDSNKVELNFLVKNKTEKLELILNESIIISEAVNKTRDMVNTAPCDFYPEIMAKTAQEFAKDAKIDCKVFGEDYLQSNKMMAMYSVGRASVHESKLIHLTYKPKNAKKKIVLVGKGLTYDSGGLSLKPSDSMVTMKADKSGACAVMSSIWAIAKLNLPIEIHAILGAVENMIGGNAYKPDDILKAKNGKTIEVRNTDAEGRLVLADCLCYAQDEIKNIDYIFDYATLTGACVIGVGEYTTGVMGNCEELKQKAVKSYLNSGEYATSLDFNRFLMKTIKSEIADVCNVANTRYGGAITAGMFLNNFIYEDNKNKWVHFDIAGPAYVEKSWGYNPYGASGAGVRATVQIIKSILKD